MKISHRLARAIRHCVLLLSFSSTVIAAQLKENSADIQQAINIPGMAVNINPGGAGCNTARHEKWEPTQNGCSNNEWVKQTARVVSVTASPTLILANNVATSTLVATVRDGDGFVVGPGIPTNWGTTRGSLSSSSTVTNSSGQTAVMLRGTIAGVATVTAAAAQGAANTAVTLAADAATSRVVSLVVNPSSVPANGTVANLYATVRDAYGNTLPTGQAIQWAATLGSLNTGVSYTDASGVAVATISSGISGISTVYAKTAVSGNASSAVEFIAAAPPVINSFTSQAIVEKKTVNDAVYLSFSGLDITNTTFSWNVANATRYEVYYAYGTNTQRLQYSGAANSFNPATAGLGIGNGVWTLKAYNADGAVTTVNKSFTNIDSDCTSCQSGS